MRAAFMQDATPVVPQGGTLSVNPLQLASRKAQDVTFAFLYIVFFAAAIGIICYTSSTARGSLDTVFTSCTNTSGGNTLGHLRAGLLGEDPLDSDMLLPDMVHGAYYLFLSLALGVLFGFAWMALLRSCAKPVVYATLILKGVILIGLGLYLSRFVSSTCTLTEGSDCQVALYPLVLCLLGVLYFLWLFCARSRIALTAKLLEQSVEVVSTHPGLFLASFATLLVKALFLFISFCSFVFLFASQVQVTVLAQGNCDFEWKYDTADEIMYGVLVIFLVWSAGVWFFFQSYIVYLVTGIWYYENESLAAQEGSVAEKEYTRAPVCSAISLACTKGFGTICFASLITTLCEMLKEAARRQSNGNGWIGCLIACCLICVANCIEFLTRFALTYAALTGDAFCTSGRTFYSNCTRHGFLKVLVVDWLAKITLQFGSLVAALLVTAITVAVVDKGVLDGPQHDDDRVTVLVAVGACAFLLSFLMLAFISGLLLDVVDAAYCCVVLDIDNHQRTGTFHRPVIAQAVMVKVKPEYVVVAQPAGGAAYAVPQATAVPVGYAQP